MASINRVSVNIPEEDMQQIKAAVQLLQDKLLPHLITLTAGDRKKMLKMGDKTSAFVRKAAQYAHSDPYLVPRYVNLENLDQDLKAIDELGALLRPMTHLTSSMDDTVTAAGSDAVGATLGVYHSAKAAAKSRVHGAQAIADDLGQCLPTRGRNAAKTTPAESAASPN